MLHLSRHLSFHARGEAAFVWHGLTGDVAEMSRDVLALMLAFREGAEEAAVLDDPPAGLRREQVEEFVPALRARRFLVRAGDEMSPLLVGVPRIPRGAVFERNERGRVTLYTRAGTSLPLDATTSTVFSRCDGEHALGQVLGDAGPEALAQVLRLARHDLAALKVLARPVSQGGLHLNPAAESTMPYPEIPDPAAYARGGEPPRLSPEEHVALSSLFADSHPSLRQRSFSQAVADALRRRGAFEDMQGRPPRAAQLGLDLDPSIERAPWPAEPESVNAVVANEVPATAELLRQAADALAPGGVLFLVGFGEEGKAELHREATQLGLTARLLSAIEALDLDANAQALATTRASWPALRALFAAHGVDLRRRAWLRTEIEDLARGKLDLSRVHGLQWAPLSERALELETKAHWVLVAKKSERVLH